ncbi:helix-turn-helix transcriptional regulator [Actinokineospora sp.]|uniref:helix-turn-helix transcriptional regulator n=1 Tax=Actinokineospora sp. TaxID=1872133 RepID=UPI003D6C42D3
MSFRTISLTDRLARIAAGTPDAKALREQVLAELARALPFDAHVWLLTDPVTRVGTSPLAAIPGLSWERLPALIKWRYLTRITRWTDLADAGTAVASLHEATGGDLAASALWREELRDLGVVDTVSVVFADRFGCWGWLDLFRYAPAKPFSATETAVLGSISAVVTTGLREAQARTFVAGAVDPEGPAFLVLGPEMRIRLQTSAAAEALHRLNPPDEPIPVVPAAAYNVAAALIAHEQGNPVGPPWSRVHLRAGHWLTLRAARVSSTGPDAADIAVSIEASTPAERLEVFACAHGLSKREHEVLTGLSTGADSRSLARRLAISEHTVNDHIKAVLAKTGSPGRQVLLSRIAGTG